MKKIFLIVVTLSTLATLNAQGGITATLNAEPFVIREAATLDTLVYIEPTGNMGIGTTNPSQKLDVDGNVNATTYFGSGNDLTFNNDSNMQPSLGLNYIIALVGTFPSRSKVAATQASPQGVDPLIGEIILFAGNFAPRGWALCQGQLLQISQHTALFSILGTTYGGDGRTTFALPDLRGTVPIQQGTGPGLNPRLLGQRVGVETIND